MNMMTAMTTIRWMRGDAICTAKKPNNHSTTNIIAMILSIFFTLYKS